MKRREFTPHLYEGRPIARQILLLVEQGKIDEAQLESLLKSLEGAADAPWASLLLMVAIGEERINRLPQGLGERLIALMQRANGDNKPPWWDKSVERGRKLIASRQVAVNN